MHEVDAAGMELPSPDRASERPSVSTEEPTPPPPPRDGRPKRKRKRKFPRDKVTELSDEALFISDKQWERLRKRRVLPKTRLSERPLSRDDFRRLWRNPASNVFGRGQAEALGEVFDNLHCIPILEIC